MQQEIITSKSKLLAIKHVNVWLNCNLFIQDNNLYVSHPLGSGVISVLDSNNYELFGFSNKITEDRAKEIVEESANEFYNGYKDYHNGILVNTYRL